MQALLILGNQLFPPQILKHHFAKGEKPLVFMREDCELATYYQFHKHKIIFFLAAMRAYATELEDAGFEVHYEKLKHSQARYENHFTDFLATKKIKEVFCFEIEDKFFETRISAALAKSEMKSVILPSPMFLTEREDFKTYLRSQRRPFMKTFYQRQRKALNILLDSKQNPVGGKWSFDEDNRLALPKDVHPPALPEIKPTPLVEAVQKDCEKFFPDHPGKVETFWLPVTRKQAHHWLGEFLKHRLAKFGPYEDAIPAHSDFLFHSVLTPFLNTGLLTPAEVVKKTLAVAEKEKIPLSSLEGFIRQIIGWREFISRDLPKL